MEVVARSRFKLLTRWCRGIVFAPKKNIAHYFQTRGIGYRGPITVPFDSSIKFNVISRYIRSDIKTHCTYTCIEPESVGRENAIFYEYSIR